MVSLWRGVRWRGNIREDDVDFTAAELGWSGAVLGLWVEAADGFCSGLGYEKTQAERKESVLDVEASHGGPWL